MGKIKVFDLALISILSAVVFAFEYVMQVLPNVQLTVLFIVLFSKKLGCIKSVFIVLIYTILDVLFMGGFNILYFPFILCGWLIIPLSINTIFKRVDETIFLAVLGVLFSLIYCWLFVIPAAFIANVNVFDYLVADLIFELILAASSFLSILWLYKPLSNLLDKILQKRLD